MSTPRTLLPCQPATMSTAQLAAVSFLARYSGRTHHLYQFQLREWFAWCERSRARPAGRGAEGARRAVHSQLGRARSDGLQRGVDDERGAWLLHVRAHRRCDHRRPGGVRPVAEGAARRVPHPRAGPAGADPVPAGRPDDHRPPRRAGVPPRRQRATGFGGRGGTDRGLRGVAARGTASCGWSARATSPRRCRSPCRCSACSRSAAGSAPRDR